ncbi:MAG: hypothetical protein KQJ78_20105 [Deltaproteobacteria bacterium]|nr:hypothetical protein [Deltaproteobacteria bacterium]
MAKLDTKEIKQTTKKNLSLFLAVALPYTLIGMAVIFGGIWTIKHFMPNSEYQDMILLIWIAIFWFIYQPMFRRAIFRWKEKHQEA